MYVPDRHTRKICNRKFHRMITYEEKLPYEAKLSTPIIHHRSSIIIDHNIFLERTIQNQITSLIYRRKWDKQFLIPWVWLCIHLGSILLLLSRLVYVHLQFLQMFSERSIASSPRLGKNDSFQGQLQVFSNDYIFLAPLLYLGRDMTKWCEIGFHVCWNRITIIAGR